MPPKPPPWVRTIQRPSTFVPALAFGEHVLAPWYGAYPSISAAWTVGMPSRTRAAATAPTSERART